LKNIKIILKIFYYYLLKSIYILEIKNKLNDNNSTSNDESVWVKVDNDKIVFTIKPQSKYVYAYSDQKGRVKKYAVDFPILKFEKSFLKSCSWVNANGKLYISGGILQDGSLSDEFMVYDIFDNSITLLKQLKEKRANHTMFFYDKNIYIVGGQNTKTVEVFNIFTQTLISKENENYLSVNNPVIWIHSNYLYKFFGVSNGKCVDIVQRALLSQDNLKWDKISFRKSNEINCKLFGSGIIPCGSSEIYFFGGNNEQKITNQSITFNFENHEFSNAGVPLEQGQFFKDNKFIELGYQTYGQFSLTEPDNFLKINVSYA